MKKTALLLLTVATFSSTVHANENTENNEERMPEDKGFYLSLAYSHLSHDINFEERETRSELDFHALMLGIGYKFNPYVAIQARYNMSLSDTDMDEHVSAADASVLSVFVKPMYPIAPEMDIYALLGYSLVEKSYNLQNIGVSEGSFSWGAGTSYDMTEDISVFAEYTQFYNDTLNSFKHVVDSFNIGLTYKF